MQMEDFFEIFDKFKIICSQNNKLQYKIAFFDRRTSSLDYI